MGDIINVVVDLSHHNGSVDLAAAQQDGIVGIIQKATQGFGNTDPTYATRRQKARDLGLMWGAYHFATGGDPSAQADHFLSVVQPGATDLLVLDLESNNTFTAKQKGDLPCKIDPLDSQPTARIRKRT